MENTKYKILPLVGRQKEGIRERHVQFSSVQLLSCVRLFATPWIATHQASLSITNSQSLLKLMPIESVMPFSHLILCRPLLGKYKYKYILVNDPAFGLGNGLRKVHFIVLYFKQDVSHIYTFISHSIYVLCLVTQSCPTLCSPMDCSPPGFSPWGFSRQEYWNGLPFPSPGDLPNPGIKPRYPLLQASGFFTLWAARESNNI